MRLKNLSEAFMTTAIMTIIIDGEATEVEMKALSNQLASLDVFRKYHGSNIQPLWDKTIKQITKTFRKNNIADISFNKTEIDMLISAIKSVLNMPLRETVYLMALELAYSDGLVEQESYLLEQLRDGLEIDSAIASELSNTMSIKYRSIESNTVPIAINNVAESFVAIAITMLVADDRVTHAEFKFLDRSLASMEVFRGYNLPQLWRTTLLNMFRSFNKSLSGFTPFTEAEVRSLIISCKPYLTSGLRESLFTMLVKLAHADGLAECEKELLKQVRTELAIGKGIAKKIIADITALPFETEVEAVLAIAVVVMVANRKITPPEFSHLQRNIVTEPIFSDIDPREFENLFFTTARKVLHVFDKDSQHPTPFSAVQLEQLIAGVNNILPSSLRESVLAMVIELSHDEKIEVDDHLFNYLREGLEIDKDVAEKLTEISVRERQHIPYKEVPIHFDTESESFMALAIAVIASDGDATESQSVALKKSIATLPFFDNYDIDQAEELFQKTLDKLLFAFHKPPQMVTAFNQSQIETIITSSNAILSPELRETAFVMATDMAYATGLNEQERMVLNHYQRGLCIERELAVRLVDLIAVKSRSLPQYRTEGPTGHVARDAFDDTEKVKELSSPITKIVIHANDSIKQIQTYYNNVAMSAHGISEMERYVIKLDKDDYLTEIYGYQGVNRGRYCLLQLSFRTKQGKSFGPYGASGGGITRNTFSFVSKPKEQIIAFCGTHVSKTRSDGTQTMCITSFGTTFCQAPTLMEHVKIIEQLLDIFDRSLHDGHVNVIDSVILREWDSIYLEGQMHFDDVYALKIDDNNLLGECGMRSLEQFRVATLNKVFGVEIFLSDTTNLRTKSAAIISPFAYHFAHFRNKLGAEVSPILAIEGATFKIKHETLVVKGKIKKMVYDDDTSEPNYLAEQFFKQLRIHLVVSTKSGIDGNDELENLIMQAQQELSLELREATYARASELVFVAGVNERRQKLLDYLQQSLAVEGWVVKTANDLMAIKNRTR